MIRDEIWNELRKTFEDALDKRIENELRAQTIAAHMARFTFNVGGSTTKILTVEEERALLKAVLPLQTVNGWSKTESVLDRIRNIQTVLTTIGF